MSKFCESTYEEAFIQLLEENGWEYTCGDDLHRKLDETIIEDDLRDYLSRKYADEALANDEIDAIVANLRNTGDTSAYLTLRKVFSLYCGRGDGFVFKRYVKLSGEEETIDGKTGTIKCNTHVNVRAKATKDSKLLGTAKNGEKFTVKGQSGNWIRIDYKE